MAIILNHILSVGIHIIDYRTSDTDKNDKIIYCRLPEIFRIISDYYMLYADLSF